jgi:subtilisin
MKKILLFSLCLSLFATVADAKRYVVTVQNDTRAPFNWDTLVSRSGGSVVEQYDEVNAALLDLDEIQAERMINNRMPGMTIEEDIEVKWILEKPSSVKELQGFSDKQSVGKNVPAAVPAVSPAQGGTRSSIVDAFMPQGEYPWSVIRMDLNDLWKLTLGQNVKVAVIDTGVNYNHPDLKDNYAGGENFWKPGTPPLDDNGHGTHIAGTIAAVHNGSGVIGVAPKAKIYALKVVNKKGNGDLSLIVAGLNWAIKNKMHIINMSLGSATGFEAVNRAVQVAVANNITVVCAAGNESSDVIYPAKLAETIAVSSMDAGNSFSYFSNFGREIDFIAPGSIIYSTAKNGKYEFLDGTSMACPHIAGMAALAYSLGYRTPEQVRSALKAAAVRVRGISAKQQGAGIPLGSRLAKYYQGKPL